MGQTYSQTFPPSPSLTETNLPLQTGKVFIITGGYSGVGLALSAILYHAGGKVYIAGRSPSKAQAAISRIKEGSTTTNSAATAIAGELHFLHLVLDDLASIKDSAEDFLARETKLDVLFNNAGVSLPPTGSVSAQGHELTMATNVLGHYLFTESLLPALRTAKGARVIWTSSMTDQIGTKASPTLTEMTTAHADKARNYANSKLGNWFLASELARREKENGIVSVSQNPGNLKSDLLRHLPGFVGYLLIPLLYDAKFGAYTELWCGCSPDLTIEDSGCYVMPWGRKMQNPRADLLACLKGKEEGGTGVAREFAEWCKEACRDYQ